MVKRGRGYPKVTIRELPGSQGGYSVSFNLPKGAAFFAMAAAITAFTELGLQVSTQTVFRFRCYCSPFPFTYTTAAADL